MSDALVVREVTDPHDPAIAGFGRMQRAAYFAPETLIPASYVPQMLRGSVETDSGPNSLGGRGKTGSGADSHAGTGVTGSRRNFLLVAEIDGQVVGGTLFHWLADAGTGFSSFMGVDRQLRRRGIARRMHEERFRVLDRAASGRAPGVFIDVVSPARMPPEELERERRAGSDPWDRRRAFARLGFGQVDIRYEQPVGGPNGGPVTILDLLYCPRDPAESVPTAIVVATMQAYWSPWLGEAEASRHARELESRASGQTSLALLSPVPGQ